MDAYGTHLYALAGIVAMAEPGGRVVEFGMGDYSTPLLSMLCETRGLWLRSLEREMAWLSRFEDLATPAHEIVHVPDWNLAPIEGRWEVAFIDHEPGHRRRVELERMREAARWIVIHDSEEPEYGLESVLARFRYRYDYARVRPCTTIVSGVSPIPLPGGSRLPTVVYDRSPIES